MTLAPRFTTWGGGRGAMVPVPGRATKKTQQPAAIPVNPYSGIAGAIGPVLTPAQILANARGTIGSSIAKEIAAYNAQANATNTQLSNQAMRAQEYAKALGVLTSAHPAEIAQQYQQAAEFEKGLGQGLTGGVADAWNAATGQAQEAVQRMSGATGGVSGYDPAAARNVAYLTGSAMPAAGLAQQGLEAYQSALYDRAASVGQAGDIGQQYLSKLADQRIQDEAARAKILATRPQLQTQLQGQLMTGRQNQINELLSLRDRIANWYTTNQANTIKQSSADAYNAYLTGKTSLSQQEALWQKQYNDARVRNTQMANVLKEAGLTGVYKGQPVVGTWFNPKTGKVEKQPSGTFVGADGNLHRIASPTTAKGAAQPSYTDIRTLQTDMTTNILDRLGLSSLAKRDVVWPRKRITEYLMNNFGSAYLTKYPSERANVKRMIDAVAGNVIAQYKTTTQPKRK